MRARIAVVSQPVHLFNTTIGENLRLARPDATAAELDQAIARAQLTDFVAGLPRGLDTQVGEQGLRVSDGERQRIGIARAFLQDAPLLLLDEPTANLDALTEQGILEAIRALRAGRTTLLITHRLVGLDLADTILVLRDGRIVESGRHSDLLQLEGAYWRMWDVARQSLSAGAVAPR